MQVDENSTFNLGDTSFRRKTLLDDYKALLPILREHNQSFPVWDSDSQATFYRTVLKDTELFERSDSDDPAKRGRTLTNALIKSGLVDNKRKLSEVANHWIDNGIEDFDDLEQALGISKDNLVFFRQFLKLRVYDKQNNFFYPFRVAIKFLMEYQNVPEKDFLVLLHSIKQDSTDSEILELISSYKEVVNNNKTFGEFISENFADNLIDSFNVEQLFSESQLDVELFNSLFVNRKSSDVQKDYLDFVEALLTYKSEKSLENLNKLLEKAKKSSIKKAFGYNALPFVAKKSVEEFEQFNQDSGLLEADNTKIYYQFVSSKKYDLVREYKDMTKRSFNLTGIFSFSNNLVNLINKDVLSILFENSELSGTEDYSHYEMNLGSTFYHDLTTMKILNFELFEVDILKSRIVDLLGTTDIREAVQNQKELKFREVMAKEFPKEKVQEILPLFTQRKDAEIQALVTDLATIPTIFEYILAIAWYYLSDEDYSVVNSLNLALDGNFKPLTHAAGGDGDIIIEYPKLTLMLEATLMNKNAQKRGELEPVIRHTANLAIREEKQVKTIFVADELDDNVINLFKASSYVEFEGTNVSGKVKGITIFALTISEINKMMEKSINTSDILGIMDNYYSDNPEFVSQTWRNEILDNIFLEG